jgi:dynein heavy chain
MLFKFFSTRLIVFVLDFADTQIVKESFLEDINNILNSGEVPNLFAADELSKIEGLVRPLVKKAGLVETRETIMAYYVHLVRENLHIVLAFSPVGSALRNRCRMFPSLVNCCTIDWFNAWPEDALFSVSHYFFEEVKNDIGIEDYVNPLCGMAVKIHRSVEVSTMQYYTELKRHNYTTPTSYLELIRLYIEMLKQQKEVVSAKESRYRLGLQKLTETEVMVDGLQKELTEMQPILKQAQLDTNVLLENVAKDQKEADEQQKIVSKDVEAAKIVAKAVSTIKADCEADLAVAMPAYEASIKALNALDKKHIQELKSFSSPPPAVGLTLNGVCLLFGVKAVSTTCFWKRTFHYTW